MSEKVSGGGPTYAEQVPGGDWVPEGAVEYGKDWSVQGGPTYAEQVPGGDWVPEGAVESISIPELSIKEGEAVTSALPVKKTLFSHQKTPCF